MWLFVIIFPYIFLQMSIKITTDMVMLPMDNHTECHCVPKKRHPHHHMTTTTIRPICACNDAIFSVPKIENGSCLCSCRTENLECRALIEGREGLSLTSRQWVFLKLNTRILSNIPRNLFRCVRNQSCDKPYCLHGLYNDSLGRCPRGEIKTEIG